jgi:hypothetical protein
MGAASHMPLNPVLFFFLYVQVRVRVMSLEFKGKRAVSLKLLDVLSRDRAEDISARAVAPGPRHRPLAIEEDEL